MGSISHSIDSRSRERILPLCSAPMTACLDIASGFQPLIQERQGHKGASPVTGHQDDHGTGAHGLGGEAEGPGLEKGELWWGSDNDLHYLQGRYEDDEGRLYAVAHERRTTDIS